MCRSKTHFLVTLFVVLISCAPALAQDNTTSTGADFLARHNITSLAVLPPLREALPPEVRTAASEMLITKLSARVPSLSIMPPNEAAEKMGQAGRLEDFASFLTLYTTTATVNKQALARIAEALGVNGLLLIDVQHYYERGGSWMRSRGGENQARVQYTLFSASGEQLWQHLEFHEHQSFWVARTARPPAIMRNLAERAVEALMVGRERRSRREPGQ